MKLVTIFAGAALAVALGSSASATTYLGTRNVGGAAVNLSITTDGVLGVLGQSDITDWNISITDSAGSVDLTPLDSQFLNEGTALSATATALSFDFSAGSGLDLWEISTIGDDGPFYCVTNGGCYGESTPSEGVSTQSPETPIEQTPYSGSVVIATAGVPEPATWAMMLVGFGGLGAAMRSARKLATATA